MEKGPQHIALFGLLLLANATTGDCFSSNEEKLNWTMLWPSKIHPSFSLSSEEAVTSQDSAEFTYTTYHAWVPGDGNNYYGMEVTIDVHGYNLQPGQISQAGIWIINFGDGQLSSMNGVQVGWQIFPNMYNDSHTHFYTAWISGESPPKDCLNMRCPGYQQTSSSIAPGDVIDPVSDIHGNKQFITLTLFKNKTSGDWHVHYGFNDRPISVGYFPKSLVPGLVDKPVEIHFGGLVYHQKPQLSPPMGSGYIPTSGMAASFNDLKFIDEDGNYYSGNKNLPFHLDLNMCYPISYIDSGRFFYGGPGCVD
ncbi:hypothetical protein ACP70R_035228 [Stipagrostis hirtigluma subsp. patula]